MRKYVSDERRFVAAPVSQTNFYIVGTVFFLCRLAHPILRIYRFPQEASNSPIVFIPAFSAPLLGLAGANIWTRNQFGIFFAAALLDAVHWIVAAIPFSYAAYWTLDSSWWAYPMTVVAVAHVVFTLVIAATYTRNVVAERDHIPYADTQKNEYEQGRKIFEGREPSSSPPIPNSRGRRSGRKSKSIPRSHSRMRKSTPETSLSLVNQQQIQARETIERLRTELLSIANISNRKARLRLLQREYHPDKNPPEDAEMAKEVFCYVQKWWDDIDGISVEEFKTHCKV